MALDSSETFPALIAFSFCRHAFIGRIPGVEVKIDRPVALQRLDKFHTQARHDLELHHMPFVTAEQVHGNRVTVVDQHTRGEVQDTDGLITNLPDVCLGIYVADCSAVYLLDPQRRCIGLIHSGKKGTELGIVPAAIEAMRIKFGCNPRDLIAQLSPCIRPPYYEIDFAAEIVNQCRAVGLQHVHDCGTCTAANVNQYYSYRTEYGQTGRMLAMLAMMP